MGHEIELLQINKISMNNVRNKDKLLETLREIITVIKQIERQDTCNTDKYQNITINLHL